MLLTTVKDLKIGDKLRLVNNDKNYNGHDYKVGDIVMVYSTDGYSNWSSLRNLRNGYEGYCIPEKREYLECWEFVPTSLRELIEKS